jgi:hypothetical protein
LRDLFIDAYPDILNFQRNFSRLTQIVVDATSKWLRSELFSGNVLEGLVDKMLGWGTKAMDGMGNVFDFLMKGVTWLYDHAIKPLGNMLIGLTQILRSLKIAWINVKIAFIPIGKTITFLGESLVWLYDHAIKPVGNLLIKIAQELGNLLGGVIKMALDVTENPIKFAAALAGAALDRAVAGAKSKLGFREDNERYVQLQAQLAAAQKALTEGGAWEMPTFSTEGIKGWGKGVGEGLMESHSFSSGWRSLIEMYREQTEIDRRAADDSRRTAEATEDMARNFGGGTEATSFLDESVSIMGEAIERILGGVGADPGGTQEEILEVLTIVAGNTAVTGGGGAPVGAGDR